MDHSSSECARQGFEDFIASHATTALGCIRIGSDSESTTQGPITDPEGRLAPARLAPWKKGYNILNDIFFNCLLKLLQDTDNAGQGHGDHPRATFPCRLYVDEMGEALSVINCEASVHLFDVDTLYKPAKKILDATLRRPSALRESLAPILRRRGYKMNSSMDGQDIEGQVVFSPHSRTINVPAHIVGHKRKRSPSKSVEPACADDDGPEAIEDEIQVGAPSPGLGQAGSNIQRVVRINSENKIKFKSGPGDYYCSFVSNAISRIPRPASRLLLIGEAKAPHKLTRELIHNTLGENTTIETMQFIQSIEQDQHGDYDEGQKWLAAVATQIYSTLLKKKRRYGYITTGESYILLRIPPGSPTTIEYLFLPTLSSQPGRQGQNHAQDDAAWLSWLAATPLSRLSCLALLSMFSDGELTQAEQDQATAVGSSTLVWRDARMREQSLESKSFESRNSAVTKISGDQEWTEQHEQNTRKRASSSDDEHHDGTIKRPRLSTALKVGSGISTASYRTEEHQRHLCLTPPPETEHSPCAPSPTQGRSIRAVPFCTSRCILSLTRASQSVAHVDPSCPNWAMHQLHGQTRDPSQVQPSLQSLVRSSIKLPQYIPDMGADGPPFILQGCSDNVLYEGHHGAVSALFKVRIEPGGYVLVAKAARSWEAVQRLKHEKTVYQRLRALQGEAIPVCAGLVDLTHGLQEEPDSMAGEFPAFLLLSWAGWSLSQCSPIVDTDLERLKTSVDAVLRQVHGLGVLHCDAEPRNIVLPHGDDHDCTLDVSLVDFERAITKGRLTRRTVRAHGHVTDEKAKLDFQRACERERKRCLEALNAWASKRKRQDEQDAWRRELSAELRGMA